MTFGPKHYVPVLKVKQNEKAALRSIQATLQQRITPFLEIVERKDDKHLDAHLTTAFNRLAESVRPYSRSFLDTREIAPDGPSAAAEVFRRASEEGILFTPVTGISRSADVEAALCCGADGVALRLTRDEFEDGELAVDLAGFMGRHGLSPEEVDLIVDLGPVDDMVTDGVAALARAFLAEVPDHTRWRSFTVSACAIPPGMGGLERNSHDLVERADWVAWRNHLYAHRAEISRLPTYSDCGIQHPSGVEDYNFLYMPRSTAIRYTLSDVWLRIKGQSNKATPERIQYPALARQLVDGSLSSHFAGVEHCEGCMSMRAAADGNGGFGAPGVWRRLGAIHHITTVMEELSELP